MEPENTPPDSYPLSGMIIRPLENGESIHHRIEFRIILWPQYRKRALEGALAERIRALVAQVCDANHWGLHEIEVLPDQLQMVFQIPQMVFQIPPELSLEKAVNRLKKDSARALRAEFPKLDEFLWGKTFWKEDYVAESVGSFDEAELQRFLDSLPEDEDPADLPEEK